MAKVLAITNVKGGVGKTTSTVNLAAAFAERGYRTLVVDLDPQASLTLSLGFEPDEQPRTIQHLLDADEELLNSTILTTDEKMDLIPANMELRSLERELGSQPTRLFAVRFALKPLRKRYDYILMDCPPNAGMLTGAALASADKVLIPLIPDFLAVHATQSLFQIIRETQKRVNPSLQIAGIYLTMYDGRTRHARDILMSLHTKYGNDVPVFSAVVHNSVRLKEAPAVGQSILKYASRSQAAQAYRVIAQEIETGIGMSKEDPEPFAAIQIEDEAPRAPVAENENATVPESNIEWSNALVPEASMATEGELASEVARPGSPMPALSFVNSTKPETLLADATFEVDDDIRRFVFVLEIDPQNEQAHTGLATRLNQVVETATPNQREYLNKLGRFLRQQGRTEDADRILQRAAEFESANQPQPQPIASAPNVTRAVDTSITPAPQAPKTVAPPAVKDDMKQQASRLIDQAAACIRTGDMTQAHTLYQQTIALNPLDPRAWVGCARTTDNLPARFSFAKQALKIDPSNQEARDVLVLANTFVKMANKERWPLSGLRFTLNPVTISAITLLVIAVLLVVVLRH